MLATLVLISGLLAALLLKGSGTPVAAPSPTAQPVPTRTPLLPGAPTDAPSPSTQGLTAAVASALAQPVLRGHVAFSVVDVLTGEPLLELQGSRPVVPASTAKLLTAMAALAALPADQALETRLVAGAGRDVVLVGGGDPTLRGAASEGTGPRLADLAAQVRRSGRAIDRVVVDDSAFAGSRLGPGWKPAYVSAGDVSPVSALELEGTKAPDPAMAAGAELAALLRVRTVVRGRAPAGAVTLASVRSAPVADLVEQMLTTSDNDLAEALGRQVALAQQKPASFAGESGAITAALAPVLAAAGVEPEQLSLVDASGLSPRDRVRAGAVTRLLLAAVRDPSFGPVLSGLPVSGFDGTLSDRFRTAPTWTAAGRVRAKTGTLTGVSALAGLVRTADGRLLAFDVTADGLPEAAGLAVPAALDRVVAALAACGCR